jgi:hypothetical protein
MPPKFRTPLKIGDWGQAPFDGKLGIWQIGWEKLGTEKLGKIGEKLGTGPFCAFVDMRFLIISTVHTELAFHGR